MKQPSPSDGPLELSSWIDETLIPDREDHAPTLDEIVIILTGFLSAMRAALTVRNSRRDEVSAIFLTWLAANVDLKISGAICSGRRDGLPRAPLADWSRRWRHYYLGIAQVIMRTDTSSLDAEAKEAVRKKWSEDLIEDKGDFEGLRSVFDNDDDAEAVSWLPEAFFDYLVRYLDEEDIDTDENPTYGRFPVFYTDTTVKASIGERAYVRASSTLSKFAQIFPDPARMTVCRMHELFISVFPSAAASVIQLSQRLGRAFETAWKVSVHCIDREHLTGNDMKRSSSRLALDLDSDIKLISLTGESAGGAIVFTAMNPGVKDDRFRYISMAVPRHTGEGAEAPLTPRRVGGMRQKIEMLSLLAAPNLVTLRVASDQLDHEKWTGADIDEVERELRVQIIRTPDLSKLVEPTNPNPAAAGRNLPEFFPYRPESDKIVIGRMQESDDIVKFSHGESGKDRSLLLKGPRSVGKSTLMETVYERLSADILPYVICLDASSVSRASTEGNSWLTWLAIELAKIETLKDIVDQSESAGSLLEAISAARGSASTHILIVIENGENLLIPNSGGGTTVEPNLAQMLDMLRRRDYGVRLIVLSKEEFPRSGVNSFFSKETPITSLKPVEALTLLQTGLEDKGLTIDDSALDKDGNLLPAVFDPILIQCECSPGAITIVIGLLGDRLPKENRAVIDAALVKSVWTLFAAREEVDDEKLRADFFIHTHFEELSQDEKSMALLIAALQQPQTEADIVAAFNSEEMTLPRVDNRTATVLIRKLKRTYFLAPGNGQLRLRPHYLDVMTHILDNNIPDNDRKVYYRAAREHYFDKLNAWTKEEYGDEHPDMLFRFENDTYIRNMVHFTRCMGYLTDEEDVVVQEQAFVALFLAAFCWFGEVWKFETCEKFLSSWKSTLLHKSEMVRVGMQKNEAGKLKNARTLYSQMEYFYNHAYTREPDRQDKSRIHPDELNAVKMAEERRHWEEVIKIMDSVERRFHCTNSADQPRLLCRINALTQVYQAQALAALGEDALPFYQRAIELALIDKDVSENGTVFEWHGFLVDIAAYWYAELANFHLDNGDVAPAVAAILSGFKAGEYFGSNEDDPDAELDTSDEDEPEAELDTSDDIDRECLGRLMEAMGNAFWSLQLYVEAFDAWRWSIYHQYIYLYWGQSYFCDEYTCALHQMYSERLVGHLLMSARNDQPVALRELLMTRSFFAPFLESDPDPDTVTDSALGMILNSSSPPRPSLYGIALPLIPARNNDEEMFTKPAPADTANRAAMIPPAVVALRQARDDEASSELRRLLDSLQECVGTDD